MDETKAVGTTVLLTDATADDIVFHGNRPDSWREIDADVGNYTGLAGRWPPRNSTGHAAGRLPIFWYSRHKAV